MSRRFSVIAVYVIHYGRDYLEYSIQSIYNHVDKIIISVGLKSWAYNRSKPIDPSFLSYILDLPKKYPKIEIVTGEWSIEEDQRNSTIEYARSFDYYFLLDHDEIYDPTDLDKLYEFVDNHPQNAVFKIPFINFWRSFGYVLEESHPTPVQRFFRTGRRFRFKLSCLSGYKARTHINVECCKCFHFSYAQTPEAIKYKIGTWMHAPELAADWYESVFEKWPQNRQMENLFLIANNEKVWKRAITFDKIQLPEFMKLHPFYEMDIIYNS